MKTTPPPAPACRPGDPEHTPRRIAEASPEAYERAAAIFRALGDTPRMRLLAQLAEGERCVSDLAEALREGLSAVSQRLRLLRAEGLVARRRDGRHIFYRLANHHVADLIDNALAHAGELDRHSHDEEDDT